ncbi:nuclear factor of activated T-cells, cytoplasmic 4 isoform X1 [Mobula hypostoma]|uniref:nuclear factor of activated T-cells, cytoplasmic 4 isoform X1 n=1 Tax=Mobula hypostoma TaxID=723540 RepID=UPI002FC2F777
MRASSYQEGEELDFGLTFGEELETGQTVLMGSSDLELPETSKDGAEPPFPTSSLPISLSRIPAPPRAGVHSPPPRRGPRLETETEAYPGQPARLVSLGNRRLVACPTIRITPILAVGEGEPEEESGGSPPGTWARGWGPPPPSAALDLLRPPPDPFTCRDWALSAASRGWLPDAASPSPSGSPSPSPSPSPSASPSPPSWGSASRLSEEAEAELSEAAWRASLASPTTPPSPLPLAHRCRPSLSPSSSSSSSPCPSPGPPLGSPAGKRRLARSEEAPGASPPHSRWGGGSSNENLHSSSSSSPRGSSPSSPPTESSSRTQVPTKSRRTSQQPRPDGPSAQRRPSREEAWPMEYLAVPAPFGWGSEVRMLGRSPVFRACALPPLDWPLPSHFNQLELKMLLQPKPHHRAHYETEGSRGAVKALAAGHPVIKLQGYAEQPLTLQMFIGTADDRNLRPHAFYQIHRISGKMVTTSSQEALVNTTKILEVPLLPENNMTANIDCAGILKLRNSDIELRKGETDIGRKNTRVRLVFRVHIPQSGGKVVSLQVSSVPIECSQRSAHELPQVGSYNTMSCPVSGGERLVITGCNFLPTSRVIFTEKGPDGRMRWEVEAKIDSAETTESNIVAEVPPYHNQSLTSTAHVCFLVCNGRRKRSPPQSFCYVPVYVKEESSQDLQTGHSSATPPSTRLASGPNSPPFPGFLSPEGLTESRPLLVPSGILCSRGLHSSLAKDNEVLRRGDPSLPFTCPSYGQLLAPPNQLPQTSQSKSLTQHNQGHPLAHNDQSQQLTQTNQGLTLASNDQSQQMTQPNQGHSFCCSDQCQPLIQPNQEHLFNTGEQCQPLTQVHQVTHTSHGQPLNQPSQRHPLAPGEQSQLLTQTYQGDQLTQPNQEQRVVHTTHSQPWTQPNREHQLVTGDHCQPLTRQHQGHPLPLELPFLPMTQPSRAHHMAIDDQCQPQAQHNPGPRLENLNHSHPLSRPNQEMPLATNHQCPLLARSHQGHTSAHTIAGRLVTRAPHGHPLTQIGTIRPVPAGFARPGQGPLSTSPQTGTHGCEAPQTLADQPRPGSRCPSHPRLPPLVSHSPLTYSPHRAPETGGQATAHPLAIEARGCPGSRDPTTGCRGVPRDAGEKGGAGEEEGEIAECEVSFGAIPIQGITLDDVNEIIGWDLSDAPESLRTKTRTEEP